MTLKKQKLETILSHCGRNPHLSEGFVNPPIQRGSTVLFPSYYEYKNVEAKKYETSSTFKKSKHIYGIYSSSTIDALEKMMLKIEGEGANRCFFQSSGLASVMMLLMGLLKQGDHLLVSDNVYYPTRLVCEKRLADFGVEVEYFDPLIGSDISKHIKPNTKLIWLESPGTHTFSLIDIPAIAKVAKANDIITVVDSTWSAGVYYKPLQLGADISLYAMTKYQMGHSDGLLGAVVVNERVSEEVNKARSELGQNPGSMEVELALRGLRSMMVRLKQHSKSALIVARHLEKLPVVEKVLYPALESFPQHKLWLRDFSGASSLFGFVLKQNNEQAIEKFVENLQLFKMGYSWGGYESLILPVAPQQWRTHEKIGFKGQLFRIFIGLEDASDLIDDLNRGLKFYNKQLDINSQSQKIANA